MTGLVRLAVEGARQAQSLSPIPDNPPSWRPHPRFYNVAGLLNRPGGEARAGRQGRMADYLSQLDFVILALCGVPLSMLAFHAA